MASPPAPQPPAGHSKQQDEERPPTKAGHGYSNELRWRSGQGRQPYANQGATEAEPAGLGDEFEAGDRAPYSGNNLEQMRRVRGKP